MELPPIIAIHGVGSHRPGQIQESVGAAFARAAVASRVSEFNWNDFIAHSVQSVGDGVALLNELAASISRTASLPLPATASKTDQRLKQVGDALYDSIFRVLIAAILTVLTIGPFIHLLVFLPAAAFTTIAWPDFQWIAAATRLGIFTAAIVFVGILVVDTIRSAAIRSAAPLRVTMRRGGLLALQPVILLLTIPLSARFGSKLVTGIVGIIPIFMVSGLINLVTSPLWGRFDFIVTSIVGTAVLGAAAAVLGGLHIVARQLWVGGPIKIILDIVRYMGSPTYRTTLQQAFDERIRSLAVNPGGERRVLLLAHSLGSVIALDSLINSREWKPTDTVYLVTLGSPIRRSFIRFFPGYLFPASVEESACLVASHVARFSWINVHRRWDYVGTGLGLDRDGLGQDLSTGQITRVVRSHSDYWSDDLVIGMIRDALERATPVAARPAASMALASGRSKGTGLSFAMPDVEESRYLMKVTSLARAFAIIVCVSMASVAVVSFARAWSTSVNEVKRSIAEVSRTGTRTVADVTYHRTLEFAGSGKDSYYYYRHHFVFTIAGQATPPPRIEINQGTVDYRFDYERLAAFVLEQCRRSEQKRWWQIFKSVREIPCTRTAIPLVYDAGKPASLWLPEFPPRRGGTWDVVGYTVAMVIVGVLFLVAWGLLVLGGGLRLFRLFLGLNARDETRFA